MTKAIVTLIIISLFVSSGFFWRQKIQELVRFGLAQISSSPAQKPVTEMEAEVENGEQEPEEELETELVLKLQLALTELQERLDNMEEEIDTLNQELERLKTEEKETEKVEKELEEKEAKEEEEEGEELEEEVGQEVGQGLCQKILEGYPAKNTVIINEVAWMGTTNSVNDEWIELKNKLSSPINLTGWQLLDKDGQIKITFGQEETIAPNGFFLLERTNDDSVPTVKADVIYNGILSNSSEALYLFDENCLFQDEVTANPNWPAGDNSSKRTMERKIDLSWQTSLNPGGTPKKENSSGYLENHFGSGGILQALPSYPKILINEIQIVDQDSEGKIIEKEDFVELFNPSDEDVNLTNWYLQRKTKGANDFSSYAPQSLFSEKIIKADNYFLIANASSTFLGDVTTTYPLTEDNTLVLKNPNREIVDKVGWGEAPDFEIATTSNPEAGKSLGRKWSTTTQSYQDTDNNFEDFEIQEPTPKEKNKSKNQRPIAIFIFSPLNPFVDEEIIFDASSSTDPDGQISTFVWDFGDGATSSVNQTTTTHSFSTSSDFLISLIVVDDENTTSLPATTTIEITSLAQPILEVSTTTLSFFGQEYGENPPNQTFSIINSGQGDLNWTASTSANWFLASSATGTVPTASSTTIEVLVNISGLVAGNYDATITVEASGAKNSPKEISINLIISPKITVLINEVQIADEEFVELYNYGEENLDVSNWYFSYFSSARDWNNPWRNKKFPDQTQILAKHYYLIGFNGYPGENGNPNADWQLATSSTLSNQAGSVAIFPWDPVDQSTTTAKLWRIDALGWGETLIKEGNPALIPVEGQSLERIAKNVDNNDNSLDFQIQTNPNPTNSGG